MDFFLGDDGKSSLKNRLNDREIYRFSESIFPLKSARFQHEESMIFSVFRLEQFLKFLLISDFYLFCTLDRELIKKYECITIKAQKVHSIYMDFHDMRCEVTESACLLLRVDRELRSISEDSQRIMFREFACYIFRIAHVLYNMRKCRLRRNQINITDSDVIIPREVYI